MATQRMEELPTEPEARNKAIVEVFYKALVRGDTLSVASLLASDLEWWFHGPPACEYMMKVLTGQSMHPEFMFEPRSITVIDDLVIVEGWEGDEAYWVHVWSVKDGLITQLREYFNTWLTVRDLRQKINHTRSRNTLWQSELREHLTRSLPGVVMAL